MHLCDQVFAMGSKMLRTIYENEDSLSSESLEDSLSSEPLEHSSSSESTESSLLSSSPVKPTIAITESNKGKPMLIVDGYGFQLKTFNRKKQ